MGTRTFQVTDTCEGPPSCLSQHMRRIPDIVVAVLTGLQASSGVTMTWRCCTKIGGLDAGSGCGRSVLETQTTLLNSSLADGPNT
jgi:hypothetical protein